MLKLRHLWDNLQSSFWFVPLLLVLVSIVLAVALIEVDSSGTALSGRANDIYDV
jgi:uncharacterized membrane protein